MIDSTELLTFINSKLLSSKNARVTAQSLLFKNHYLDSITILSLIGYIEKKLERKLGDQEITLQNFESVSAIVSSFASHEPKE